MKIVIEIDDARFKDIRRIACVQLENYHFKTVEQIIANGTPLPDRMNSEWISIDKNVPTNGQRVLVCFNDGFILIGAYINYAEDEEDKEESFWVFDGEEDFNLEDAQVIAWMPLPEPYNAESEVEE